MLNVENCDEEIVVLSLAYLDALHGEEDLALLSDGVGGYGADHADHLHLGGGVMVRSRDRAGAGLQE